MMNFTSSLVSILIPTWNRVSLIGDTLDSILAQSYENWECIVVDDGSSDYTAELMSFYCEMDSRISYFSRPKDIIKGANSCRNLAFLKSNGKYIQWLDSDDLLLPESLLVKVNAIENGNFDFVVAKLVNFFPDGSLKEQFYNREENCIAFEDFLFRKINWITPDALISKDVLVKNQIRFNEMMRSDQEYNYYCQMLAYTERGKYIDQVLTKRRLHELSIQSERGQGTENFPQELFRNRFLTFKDLEGKIELNLLNKFLEQIMTICFFNTRQKVLTKYSQELLKIVKKYKSPRQVFYFYLALFSAYFTGKGYFLLQKAKEKKGEL